MNFKNKLFTFLFILGITETQATADTSTMMAVIQKYLSTNEEVPRVKNTEIDTCTNVSEDVLKTLSTQEKTDEKTVNRKIAEQCTVSKNKKDKRCIWDNDLKACFAEVNTTCENIASRTLCFLNANPNVQCDWDESSSTCNSLGN